MKTNTYIYTFLLGLDRFAAALLFNRADITISSLCWIMLNANSNVIAFKALEKLRLWSWQGWFLVYCGKMLEWMSPGHCYRAKLHDTQVADNIHILLCGTSYRQTLQAWTRTDHGD